jgi:cytidylate kinase
MKKKYIIAIDGPSGAGKSTVSQKLADRLGYLYLDTGAMYRAVGLKCLRQKLDMDNPEELKTIVPDLKIELKKERDKLKVLLDGEDVSEEIRRPEMGMAASRVSRHRVIREKLWELQRKLGEKGGVVAEGRDMGTVVFPHAEFKFFVTASAEERARRRFKELTAKGFDVNYDKILAEVKERDEQDSKRELAPLKSAEDAIIVDTTEMTLEQVVDKLLKIILEKDFQK